MADEYSKIAAIVLPLIGYGVAQLVHGNGFVAAFILGATGGNVPVAEDKKTLNERKEGKEDDKS